MEVVTAEARSSAGEGSPLKIALFSLGNMCAHPVCAEALLSLGAREPLIRLGRSPDSTIQRYVQRIQVQSAVNAHLWQQRHLGLAEPSSLTRF